MIQKADDTIYKNATFYLTISLWSTSSILSVPTVVAWFRLRFYFVEAIWRKTYSCYVQRRISEVQTLLLNALPSLDSSTYKPAWNKMKMVNNFYICTFRKLIAFREGCKIKRFIKFRSTQNTILFLLNFISEFSLSTFALRTYILFLILLSVYV